MKKNKKVVIIISIVILTIISIIMVFKKDTSIVEKNKVNKIERKEFNIYLQKTVGSKDYDPSTDTTFPTSGYLLNTTKTVCKGYNGNKLNINPVTQELTDGVINGSITINSNNTIYCDLYFDKNETPTINTFNVTGKTSGGTTLNNSFTYQTDNIPFTVTYTDNESDVKQYCINETNSIENCNWQTLSETNSYSLKDNKDGEKTMYIYLKDTANNVSTPSNKSITVDKIAPVVTSFTLKGTADEGQQLSNSETYTHKKEITINATIEENNIDQYCIYEDNCRYTNLTSTTITDQNYTLKDTEGEHTLTIKVKDKAGNESDINTTSTKSIKLDKTNPTAKISQNSVTTESITVTVGYQEPDSIIKRQCKLDSGSTWTDANPDGSCTISDLKDGQTYKIEGRVRDASGRYSQSPYPSVSVTTDYAYRCDVGTLVEDPSKGWICTTNGKTLMNTYWTCSAEPAQKYSSESRAKSACESSVSGECSYVEREVECVGGELIGASNYCKTGGPGTCSFAKTEYGSDWYRCSVRPGRLFGGAAGYCERVCFEGYDTTKILYTCEFDGNEYDEEETCDKLCVKTSTLGTVQSVKDVSYYCESGWSELSHSGTSELVCYKDAIRG